jgi:cell division protein FtsW (lipid II flippase)
MVGLGGMALVFVNSAISGQRIALALVPLVTVILLILTGQVTNLKRFLPIAAGLGLVLGIAVIANPQIIQERIDSFVSRWNASPPTAFIAEQFEHTAGGQQGIFGKGIGRATNSTRIFGNTKLVETYYPKLIYEIGPVGTIAFLGLVTTLTVTTFKTYRSLKEKNIRSFGASFWVFVLIMSYNTYYYPLDVDPVAVYYWYFVGVIYKLPDIDKEELKRLKEEEEEGG